MTDQKKWYSSKTLWFNLFTLLLAVLGTVSKSPLLADKVQVLGILATVQTVGNVLLRLFFTSQPIEKSLT